MGKRVDSEYKSMSVALTGHENMMDEGSTLVSKTDLTGKITFVNEHFLNISGFTEGDLLGKPHNMIRHPAMPRSAFWDLWNNIKKGKPWRGMVVNRCKDGNHYWVDANVAPQIENGKVSGYMSVRRKPSRTDIENAEKLYKEVIEGKKAFPYSDQKMISFKGRQAWLHLVYASFPLIVFLLFYFGFHWIWALLLTGISGLFIFTSGFMMTRFVLKPISVVSEMANRIAAGDLTVNIPHNRNDEIGELFKSLLNMLVNIAGLVGVVKENSSQISESSLGLKEASNSLFNGSESTSSHSETIAASATEMNQTLQMLSSGIEEMSVTISEVARRATDAANIVKGATRTADDTNIVVQELGKDASEIGDVIENIVKIASQTNLLALNASIEAASAGAAGKGFAVVAAEVKDLARQTAKSSDEIRQKVQAVQKSSQKAVDAIATLIEVFNQMNEISSTIASAVEEQSIASRELASNVSQTSVASNDVTKNINLISSSAREGLNQAGFARNLSESFAEMSKKLYATISEYKI
ncbi:MAG: methyl-accepting chemotaxis protein [Spirochaetia bacterium]|nr:methyl-accepting chemotaxis protein [Spirochaetia bacterium]